MITLREAVVLCSTFVCFPLRLTHLIVLCILSCFMSSWSFLCSGCPLHLHPAVSTGHYLQTWKFLSVLILQPVPHRGEQEGARGSSAHLTCVLRRSCVSWAPPPYVSSALSDLLCTSATTISAGMKPYCCPPVGTSALVRFSTALPI